MSNPLDNLPFNTNSVYTMAITKSGCEVYFPVVAKTDEEILAKRDILQEIFDNQTYTPPSPTEPMIA